MSNLSTFDGGEQVISKNGAKRIKKTQMRWLIQIPEPFAHAIYLNH